MNYEEIRHRTISEELGLGEQLKNKRTIPCLTAFLEQGRQCLLFRATDWTRDGRTDCIGNSYLRNHSQTCCGAGASRCIIDRTAHTKSTLWLSHCPIDNSARLSRSQKQLQVTTRAGCALSPPPTLGHASPRPP
jgi:hypothetical protein